MCHLRLGFVVLYVMAQRSLDVNFDNGKSVSSDFCATQRSFVKSGVLSKRVCQNLKTRSVRPAVHKVPRRRRRKKKGATSVSEVP